MTCLAPNERLNGSPQVHYELLGRLTTLRISPDLNHHHSELSFTTLSDALRHSAPLDLLRAQTLCGVNTVSIRCCPMTVTLGRDDGQAGHAGVVAVLGG
jgi:hypothetical protein